MSDDPKTPPDPPSPPEAAGDKPASAAPAEPLKGEVSRTDAPGAGASAAPIKEPIDAPTKPANPAAVATAVTSQASSAGAAPQPPAKPAPAAAAHAAPKAAGPPAGPIDPAPPADLAVPGFITSLQTAVPGAVEQLTYWVGDWTVIVPAARLLGVARHLRDAADAQFDFCSDVTASDWPPRPQRFDVIYCLFSTRRRHRVRIKVRAGEGEPVPSVTALWPAANWLEREVYDLFGVNFTGHPDRRRILMPDEWQGHPQRKDYPLEGPGELLMENPQDWLRLRNAQDQADIE